jgi:hypothetical protein
MIIGYHAHSNFYFFHFVYSYWTEKATGKGHLCLKTKTFPSQKYMQEKEKEVDDIKMFQWKKGDNFGNVVSVLEETEDFWYFTNGTRIYKSLVNEFLEPISDINILPFPPSNSMPTNAKLEVLKEQIEVEVNNPIPKKEEVRVLEESALEKLIVKLSSKNIETISINIAINIPKREVFDMLLDNSDELQEDMIDTVTKTVISQIEIDNLQIYIGQQVTNFLNNYYNGTNTVT